MWTEAFPWASGKPGPRNVLGQLDFVPAPPPWPHSKVVAAGMGVLMTQLKATVRSWAPQPMAIIPATQEAEVVRIEAQGLAKS
jgi:hypothetical protein